MREEWTGRGCCVDGKQRWFSLSGFWDGRIWGGGCPATKKDREYLYHAGAVGKWGKAKISNKILEEVASNDFELGRVQGLRYRSRYFTDSGIIGSKAFVLSTYELFKDRLYGSRERVPKRGSGFDGMKGSQKRKRAGWT